MGGGIRLSPPPPLVRPRVEKRYSRVTLGEAL